MMIFSLRFGGPEEADYRHVYQKHQQLDPGSFLPAPFLAPVRPEESRKGRRGESLHTSVVLVFDTIVELDVSCLFAPCALAWPLAYCNSSMETKEMRSGGILCQHDLLAAMLPDKLQ